MSDKRPQPTAVLVKRLRRVGKWIHAQALETKDHRLRARANTCWQAAGRLEDLEREVPAAQEAVRRLMDHATELEREVARLKADRNRFEDLLVSMTYDKSTDTMTMPASTYRAAINR